MECKFEVNFDDPEDAFEIKRSTKRLAKENNTHERARSAALESNTGSQIIPVKAILLVLHYRLIQNNFKHCHRVRMT